MDRLGLNCSQRLPGVGMSLMVAALIAGAGIGGCGGGGGAEAGATEGEGSAEGASSGGETEGTPATAPPCGGDSAGPCGDVPLDAPPDAAASGTANTEGSTGTSATATTSTTAAGTPGQTPEAIALAGRRLFERRCDSCHPGGDEDIGPRIIGVRLTPERMRRQIRQGSGRMRPIPVTRLSDPDMEILLAHLVTIRAVRSAQ